MAPIKCDGHYMYGVSRIVARLGLILGFLLTSDPNPSRVDWQFVEWNVPRHRSVHFDTTGSFEDRHKSLIANQFSFQVEAVFLTNFLTFNAYCCLIRVLDPIR